MNVEICGDDLKEGRRIFVCLNACKKNGRRVVGQLSVWIDVF